MHPYQSTNENQATPTVVPTAAAMIMKELKELGLGLGAKANSRDL